MSIHTQTYPPSTHTYAYTQYVSRYNLWISEYRKILSAQMREGVVALKAGNLIAVTHSISLTTKIPTKYMGPNDFLCGVGMIMR